MVSTVDLKLKSETETELCAAAIYLVASDVGLFVFLFAYRFVVTLQIPKLINNKTQAKLIFLSQRSRPSPSGSLLLPIANRPTKMAAITDNVSRVEMEMADAESVGDISGTSSEVDNNLNPKNPVVPRRTFKVNKKPGRKLKVPADWSDKYVYKLIEFVRDSPVLWDSDVKGSSIQTRRNLWTELSQKVLRSKYDPEEVNAKWKHMRVQYKNYANRKPIPGRTLNPIVWRFYRYMQFVDKINIDVVFPPAESESVSMF